MPRSSRTSRRRRSTGRRAPTVAAGELIVLEAAIDHEVYAVEESVVLLTLAGEKEH